MGIYLRPGVVQDENQGSSMNKTSYYAVRKANGIGAMVNFIQAIVKVIVGIVGNSPALFADGLHSFSDLAANLLVWIASKVSHIEPDENHPYGHGRFETMGSLILGVFLVFIALGIAYHGLNDILQNARYVPNRLTLIVAALSVVANESVYHYTLRIATVVSSPLLRANAYHVRSDSLSSVIVVIGMLGALAGFPFCDAIAGILIAGFILKIALTLVWRAVYELTDASVPHAQIKEFEAFILSLSGVRAMHRLRTRKMAERVFLDVHILIDVYASASEGHYIAETVRVGLMKKYSEIEDITVHVDIEDHPETLPKKLPLSRREISPLLPLEATHFDLYYFQDHIEVRVDLPLAVLSSASSDVWCDTIKVSLASRPEIQVIRVCYG